MLAPLHANEGMKENATNNNQVELKWHTSYEEALKEASKEGKKILADFTGSDWCAYCIHMKDTVLSSKQFKDYASKNLVLLTVDFPRKKKLPEQQAKTNEDLRKKHGVRGFPTYVILDAKGNKISSISHAKTEVFIDTIDAAVYPNKDFATVDWELKNVKAANTASAKLREIKNRAKQNGKPILLYIPDNGSTLKFTVGKILKIRKLQDYLSKNYNCLKISRPNLFAPIEHETPEGKRERLAYEAKHARKAPTIPLDTYNTLLELSIDHRTKTPAFIVMSPEGKIIDSIYKSNHKYIRSFSPKITQILDNESTFLMAMLEHNKAKGTAYPKTNYRQLLQSSGTPKDGLKYANEIDRPLLAIFFNHRKAPYLRDHPAYNAIVNALGNYAQYAMKIDNGFPPVGKESADLLKKIEQLDPKAVKRYSESEYNIRKSFGLESVAPNTSAIGVVNQQGRILALLKSHNAKGEQNPWYKAIINDQDPALLVKQIEASTKLPANDKPTFAAALQKDEYLELKQAPEKVAPLALGDPAPELSIGKWLKGKGTTLADLKGKVVLLDFWATWCKPCVASIPKLNALQKKHKDNLVIIAITPENNITKLTNFANDRNDLVYRMAMDGAESTIQKYNRPFKVASYPHAYLIDKKGILRWHGNPGDQKTLNKKITELLNE